MKGWGVKLEVALISDQKTCKVINLLTNKWTENTVGSNEDESQEAVPDNHKLLDESEMTETPAIVHLARDQRRCEPEGA